MGLYSFDNALAAVKTLYQAGVAICAGTGASPSPELNISFGESIHEEMELLVLAGMPELEAVRSATCGCAETLGLKDRGMLQPGQLADLVLLEGNPLDDITKYQAHTQGLAQRHRGCQQLWSMTSLDACFLSAS